MTKSWLPPSTRSISAGVGGRWSRPDCPPRADAPGQGWMRHVAEGPDDMPAHLKAAILPVSLQIPVRGGAMTLGTWQGIYVVEHRDRPHRRSIAVHFLPDRAG